MPDIKKKADQICFVCSGTLVPGEFTTNQIIMLPVCSLCKGSYTEKKKECELLDSLADGLFCGCI